jgi:uncharacterized Zn finger protein
VRCIAGQEVQALCWCSASGKRFCCHFITVLLLCVALQQGYQPRPLTDIELRWLRWVSGQVVVVDVLS